MPNSPIPDVDHHDANHHDADRETLSALFDGQLAGDAARFALKRLGHDPQWRRTCGHWQLAGDVLRGNTGAIAPPDFAARVMAAVAHESRDDLPATSAKPTAVGAAAMARRRWIGGAALAASVAMAALFVVRPLTQTEVPMPGTPAQQVTTSADGTAGGSATVEAGGAMPASTMQAQASTLQIASVPQAPLPQAPIPQPVSPDNGSHLATAAAAIAVAELPRRASERRSRGQSQRAARRVASREVPAQALAAASVAPGAPSSVTGTLAEVDVDAGGASVHPFQPRGEIASRPWPRATLAGYPVAGETLTASYDGGDVADSPSPSFYPFQPQALQDDAAAPRSDWPQATDWP
ncbi:sigma-E factor negative regulatory protein [Lysobacter sp. A421]